eukprot:NODE_5062_length_728_cov_570.504160_g5039_i0.p1 GENE.NODE_5062_length_728_cov_570.504160_g5039_i0~~NODE_5062_length_728_cov_570.504160_g5039_i0.p1  ORF type:complete len:130 (+),score=3.82 NODE_5062_length_728_cov_570.504160_g5039_i0:246-635(+)
MRVPCCSASTMLSSQTGRHSSWQVVVDLLTYTAAQWVRIHTDAFLAGWLSTVTKFPDVSTCLSTNVHFTSPSPSKSTCCYERAVPYDALVSVVLLSPSSIYLADIFFPFAAMLHGREVIHTQAKHWVLV